MRAGILPIYHIPLQMKVVLAVLHGFEILQGKPGNLRNLGKLGYRLDVF
jgi:hypothetical protein